MRHIKDHRLANLKAFQVICDFTQLDPADGAFAIRTAREMLMDQNEGPVSARLPSSRLEVKVTLERDIGIPIVSPA